MKKLKISINRCENKKFDSFRRIKVFSENASLHTVLSDTPVLILNGFVNHKLYFIFILNIFSAKNIQKDNGENV